MKKCLKISALCLCFALLISTMLVKNIPKLHANSYVESDFDGAIDNVYRPLMLFDYITITNTDWTITVGGFDSIFEGFFDYDNLYSNYYVSNDVDEQVVSVAQSPVSSADFVNGFEYSTTFSDFDSELSFYFFSDSFYLPVDYDYIPIITLRGSGFYQFKICYIENGNVYFEEVYRTFNNSQINSVSLVPGTYLETNSVYNSNGYVYIVDYVLGVDVSTSFSIINYCEITDKYDYADVYFDRLIVSYSSPGAWLLNSLDSFMSFELVPGFSLSTLFAMIVLIPLILFLCKLFLGG